MRTASARCNRHASFFKAVDLSRLATSNKILQRTANTITPAVQCLPYTCSACHIHTLFTGNSRKDTHCLGHLSDLILYFGERCKLLLCAKRCKCWQQQLQEDGYADHLSSKSCDPCTPGHIYNTQMQRRLSGGLEQRAVPWHSMVHKTPLCNFLPAC